MKKIILLSQLIFLTQLLQAQIITKVEYFIDKDPGYGLANDVSLTAANDLDLNFIADITNLAEGIHTFFVRAKDANNKWSLNQSHVFYIGIGASNQPISNIEYYFDFDPGYGNGTQVSVTPENNIDFVFNVDVSQLEDGLHTLFVRAKDISEQWSLTKTHTFYKGAFSSGSASKIQTIEYFFDIDPGFGNGKNVTFVADTLIDLTFNADLTGLSDGFHTMFIRARNEDGAWSLIKTHSFWNTITVINDHQVSNFLILPNPSNGDFTLQFESGNSKSILEIWNITGQIVLSKNYHNNSVTDNISLNSAKGLFLLKLVSGDETITKKVVVE